MDSGNMQDYEEEAKNALADVKKELSALSKRGGDDLDVDSVTEKINFAKAKIRRMEIEQRNLDRAEARKWNPIIKELQDDAKDVEEQIMWKTGGRRLAQTDKLQNKYGMGNP